MWKYARTRGSDSSDKRVESSNNELTCSSMIIQHNRSAALSVLLIDALLRVLARALIL